MGIELRLAVAAIGLMASALAQINAPDAAELRAKYGRPLARETFIIPVGEMIVDYGATGHICKIQLAPVAPDNRQLGSEKHEGDGQLHFGTHTARSARKRKARAFR